MNTAAIRQAHEFVELAWNQTAKYEEHLASAAAVLNAANAAQPDDGLVLSCLGAVLSDQGHHKKAVEYLQQAIQLGCDDKHTYYNLAVAQMNCTQRGAAMRNFRAADKREALPDTWRAYFDPQGC